MIVLLKLAEIEHDLSRVRETFVACWGVPLPLQLGASARRSAAHPSHLVPSPDATTATVNRPWILILNYPQLSLTSLTLLTHH